MATRLRGANSVFFCHDYKETTFDGYDVYCRLPFNNANSENLTIQLRNALENAQTKNDMITLLVFIYPHTEDDLEDVENAKTVLINSLKTLHQYFDQPIVSMKSNFYLFKDTRDAQRIVPNLKKYAAYSTGSQHNITGTLNLMHATQRRHMPPQVGPTCLFYTLMNVLILSETLWNMILKQYEANKSGTLQTANVARYNRISLDVCPNNENDFNVINNYVYSCVSKILQGDTSIGDEPAYSIIFIESSTPHIKDNIDVDVSYLRYLQLFHSLFTQFVVGTQIPPVMYQPYAHFDDFYDIKDIFPDTNVVIYYLKDNVTNCKFLKIPTKCTFKCEITHSEHVFSLESACMTVGRLEHKDRHALACVVCNKRYYVVDPNDTVTEVNWTTPEFMHKYNSVLSDIFLSDIIAIDAVPRFVVYVRNDTAQVGGGSRKKRSISTLRKTLKLLSQHYAQFPVTERKTKKKRGKASLK